MHNIMWFRRDLRVHDNPALSEAVGNGPTVAVFCITEKTWAEHRISPAKKSLLFRQLDKLERALSTLNIPLIIVDCERFSRIPAALFKAVKSLSETHVPCALYFNHEYELDESQCTQDVTQAAAQHGIAVHDYHDQCAIRPGAITTASGDMYKVFTAFKKNYIHNFLLLARPVYPTPKKQAPTGIHSDLSVIKRCAHGDHHKPWQSLWPAGENEAHKRLKAFLKSPIDTYDKWRDFPSVKATSTLSPYLAIGAISTRQCFAHAGERGREDIANAISSGAATWIVELVWREFYRHLITCHPKLSRYQPFIAKTDAIPWSHNEALFEKWTNGTTGYPIVDAAMRQLQAIGWMHNRLRMVTAMFLTKHLLIDWRLGERFFMEHLVDGDLASNNGGWQWSASTGVDAAPYFRIFNPVRQSERFDPKGLFIREYVPALQSLDNKSIHLPSKSQALELGYPPPIVVHRDAVERTKALFKAL